MLWARVQRRVAGVLGIIALSIVVPACNSPGGCQFPWLRRSCPDSTNVVQRPAYDYDFPQRRPLVVGGYAGASYGPNLRAGALWTDPAGAPAPGRPNLSINQGSWEPE
jgi:hypothetical protein